MKKTYTTPATCAVKTDSGDMMVILSVNDGSETSITGESNGETPAGDDDSYWGAWTRKQEVEW